MNLNFLLPSPITYIKWPFFGEVLESMNNISIVCKRDDLIHPIISGNKWRKLSITLARLQAQKCQRIVSFGGAYSNHLHALSYACKCLNINLTAVIRGNHHQHLSPTLRDMVDWGSTLHFVSNIDYRRRTDKHYCENIKTRFNASDIIPEGGSSKDSLRGVADLMSECKQQTPDVTHILIPVASGGTLAGLLTSDALPDAEIVGIGVLKGEGYLENLVNVLATNGGNNSGVTLMKKKWQILHTFHHGGYAKKSDELVDFVSQFNLQFTRLSNVEKMIIEPVYSGKCFYALDQLLRAGFFPANSKIMIVHTGGIQGARQPN